MTAPLAIEQSVIDDLRERLRRTRWVDAIPAEDGALGVDRRALASLLEYWADGYDWSAQERRLLALPWVVTGDGDTAVRAIHQRVGDDAPTVVLLHGWPDSFLRYERVLPLLSDVNVVVPALPGFPYSASGAARSTGEMADLFDGMMTELGYDHFIVSGGDIGSSLAERWASQHPDHVSALHLTDVPYTHLFTVDGGDLSDEEQRYLQAGEAWQFAEGAYALEQSTKPNTLSIGLGDSPAGLAAWIVEKLGSWSDSGGGVEAVFPRDDLLTWLTLYWVTGSIGTSFASYATEEDPLLGRLEVPTVVSIFPKDLVTAPRVFGEHFFNVVEWTEHPSGGHFGAWERPEWFVDGVRAAVGMQDDGRTRIGLT